MDQELFLHTCLSLAQRQYPPTPLDPRLHKSEALATDTSVPSAPTSEMLPHAPSKAQEAALTFTVLDSLCALLGDFFPIEFASAQRGAG